jgi:hypothetical protein
MPKTIASPIKYCGSSYQIKSGLTAMLAASLYTMVLSTLLGCANVPNTTPPSRTTPQRVSKTTTATT